MASTGVCDITVRTRTLRTIRGKDGLTVVDMVMEYESGGRWLPLSDGEIRVYVDDGGRAGEPESAPEA